MNGFSAAISGIGSAIGRYFSIVSFVPSFFLVGFIFALVESRSWESAKPPDWSRAGTALTHIGDLGLLVLVSIGIGIIIHPLQLSLVRMFEGYWGTGSLAQRMRVVRIRHHYYKYRSLRFGDGAVADIELNEADEAAEEIRSIRSANAFLVRAERIKELEAESPIKLTDRIRRRSLADESMRLADFYPDLRQAADGRYDDLMPTRLGNVLRRYERQAGSQYGLDLIKVAQQISFVAPAERLNYIGDQRQLLDLSVRMSAMSVVATFAAVTFLCRQGLWLLVALAPWTIAYLSYRGAVIVAHEYGSALCAMVDLDRFAMYESLKIQPPVDTTAEREMNEKLIGLLDHRSDISISYKYGTPANHNEDKPAGT